MEITNERHIELIKSKIEYIKSATNDVSNSPAMKKLITLCRSYFKRNEISEISAKSFGEMFNVGKELSLKILIAVNKDYFNNKTF